MEVLDYDYDWEDLSSDEGVVIQKCTVYGADLAYRSPQFPDWIHVEKDGKTITVLNGYDPNWNHDYSMLDWQNEDGNSMIDEIIGFDFLELLKEHDGVFIDTAAIQERYMEWDGEGDFNVSDLVKPYNY